MTFTFRTDQPDVAISILREVGQWLVDTNRPMWDVDSLTPENLIDEHTRDGLYVLYARTPDRAGDLADKLQAAETPAAVFILQWTDPLYYDDVPPNTAGFIHKVAIRRQFAGQNLFQAMLDFCRTSCLSRGIHEIQLETDATKPALLQFYERHGFRPTRRRVIEEFGQTFDCQYYSLTF